jgi:hypothetical protein
MATNVHEIWNFYSSKGEVDKRVRHLQLISVRLLNIKLQFTARHFFNLDWSFCHTVSLNLKFDCDKFFILIINR